MFKKRGKHFPEQKSPVFRLITPSVLLIGSVVENKWLIEQGVYFGIKFFRTEKYTLVWPVLLLRDIFIRLDGLDRRKRQEQKTRQTTYNEKSGNRSVGTVPASILFPVF